MCAMSKLVPRNSEGKIITEMPFVKNQTNEEWLNRLSTKDKAKWIAYQIYYVTKCDVYSENRKDWSSKDWEVWLKQPHREEVAK